MIERPQGHEVDADELELRVEKCDREALPVESGKEPMSIGKSRFRGPFQRPRKGRSRHPLRCMSGEASDGRVHSESSGRALPGS